MVARCLDSFRVVLATKVSRVALQRDFGAIAQLGERCVRNAEVGGSTPLRSNGVKPCKITACSNSKFSFFGSENPKTAQNAVLCGFSVRFSH